VVVDNQRNLSMSVADPLTAFGELLSVHPTPVAQINYTYGIHPSDVETFTSFGTYATMNTEGDVSTQQAQSVYLPKGASFSTGGAADYFTMEDGGGNPFYVWFDVSNGNSDPSPGGTGLEVDITAADTSSTVASAAQAVINGDAAFSATVFGNIVTITNAANGDVNSVDLTNMPTTSNSTIGSTKGSSLAEVTIGDGVADYAVLRTRRNLRYRPGMGGEARFTTIYDTPTAGVTQWFGMSNSTSALVVGYQGTQFGISIRSGGLHEIRKLTITAAGAAGTVIVTVDGIDHTVTVTNAGTTQEIAADIAAHNYRTGLYVADYVDNIVWFVSERLGSPVGTQTFAFALGTATGIAANFTQVTATQAMTTTTIPQTSWNLDRMDGTGLSKKIFNPLKGNVFKIQYQWLGFGGITFLIEDSVTAKFIPIHIIRYANENTLVSLSKPNMQLSYILFSTTGTTSKTIKSASAALFVQGQLERFDPIYNTFSSHAGISGANTNAVLLAITSPRVYANLTSTVEINFKSLNVSSSKGSNNTKVVTEFDVYFGGTPSTTLDYQYVSEGLSAIAIAKPAVGTTTLTGGIKVFSVSVPAEGVATIDLSTVTSILQKNSTGYITYSNPAPSTSDIDLSASLTWVEDH
jgi:hypothetical protein